jgi:hypothetical protein
MARFFDTLEIPLGAGARFDVGPSSVWIERRAQEWRLAHHTRPDPAESTERIEGPGDPLAPDEGAIHLRCPAPDDSTAVTIVPRAADRPVVIRPETTMRLLPGAKSTLFVTTPAWLELRARSPLLELPSFRPSDTWFGPNTTEGELCYASTTSGRLELETLPIHPARVATALTVENESDEALIIERVKLPMLHLSVFVGRDGRLWTESVDVTKKGDGEAPVTRIGQSPPPVAEAARELGEPRQRDRNNVVLRAFGALVG